MASSIRRWSDIDACMSGRVGRLYAWFSTSNAVESECAEIFRLQQGLVSLERLGAHRDGPVVVSRLYFANDHSGYMRVVRADWEPLDDAALHRLSDWLTVYQQLARAGSHKKVDRSDLTPVNATVHRNVRAVVSLAAFAHPREVMRAFMAEKRVPYPLVGWYVMRQVQRVIGTTFDEIAPVHTIARVQCPVLVVHGQSDSVVPMGDAKRLVERSARAQLLLVDGSHDLRDALAPRVGMLVDFLHAACMADETPSEALG